LGTVLLPRTQNTENIANLYGRLDSLNAECKKCKPITPFECINHCRVYKIKNELRHLQETMGNPNYVEDLFNVLKNKTRLQILRAIVTDNCSLIQLQKEVRKTGQSCGRDTLYEQYVYPLLALGLVAQVRDQYNTTIFGSCLVEKLASSPDFAGILPTNSNGYEEILLCSMFTGPKIFEDLEALIQPTNVSRVLKRLVSADLVKTPSERDYVFFFKTIRDPKKGVLTASEQRIYDAVAKEGVSAGKLATETGSSLRNTYKYLKSLKCKKLVFVRKSPKVYDLTFTGKKMAVLLRGLQQTVEDAWNCSLLVMQEKELCEHPRKIVTKSTLMVTQKTRTSCRKTFYKK
jgi:DNA-binding transcriptional ArsR family regulator